MPELNHKLLSDIPVAAAPSINATVVIIDGGSEWRVPITAIVPIDRAITSSAQLPAGAAAGEVKWFVNSSRDALECREYRADGKWHLIL